MSSQYIVTAESPFGFSALLASAIGSTGTSHIVFCIEACSPPGSLRRLADGQAPRVTRLGGSSQLA